MEDSDPKLVPVFDQDMPVGSVIGLQSVCGGFAADLRRIPTVPTVLMRVGDNRLDITERGEPPDSKRPEKLAESRGHRPR